MTHRPSQCGGGLDLAIQRHAFRAWTPVSRPGMTVRVTNTEIWYQCRPIQPKSPRRRFQPHTTPYWPEQSLEWGGILAVKNAILRGPLVQGGPPCPSQPNHPSWHTSQCCCGTLSKRPRCLFRFQKSCGRLEGRAEVRACEPIRPERRISVPLHFRLEAASAFGKAAILLRSPSTTRDQTVQDEFEVRRRYSSASTQAASTLLPAPLTVGKSRSPRKAGARGGPASSAGNPST